MKLFIWKDPYQVDNGGSCLYVVARDIRQARRLAKTAQISKFGYEPEPSNFINVDKDQPDRIVNLPYAECYEWSE